MIENKERLLICLNSEINSVWKILPLYEEKNIGIEIYIESLLFKLYSLDKVISIDSSFEFISLLSILESIQIEISSENGKHSTIKREIFKCIDIIKTMVSKLEEGM